MVGHWGSSAGSYLTDPTSPIPSHCASIVMTSTVRVNIRIIVGCILSEYTGICHLEWLPEDAMPHCKHVPLECNIKTNTENFSICSISDPQVDILLLWRVIGKHRMDVISVAMLEEFNIEVVYWMLTSLLETYVYRRMWSICGVGIIITGWFGFFPLWHR